jgi:hypothetical protein
MMAVILLLAFVFIGFAGVLLHMQAVQVNSDHTQADTFPVWHRNSRYEHNKVIINF